MKKRKINAIEKEEKVETNNGIHDKKNSLNNLTGKEWIQETKSFFYQKGIGLNSKEAKYEKLHPAPFSFTDISKLIKFFTKNGGTVLDPFCGVGSTLKASYLLNRDCYGVEINKKWYTLTKKRMLEECSCNIDKEHLILADSRDLNKLFKKEFFDFIITSPPYWSILDKKDHKANIRVKNGYDTKYSDNKKDLANINDYQAFLDELSQIFFKCYDVLKENKYMCVIVSDFRHKSEFIAYHADLINKLCDKKLEKRFVLQGIKVIIQNAKKLFPYGYPYSYVENIHHQYALILKKPNG